MGRSSQRVYPSVKAYSKKGKLLSKTDLQTLAESRDLDELMVRIKNTVYSDAVNEIEKPYTSRGIEKGLRSHLADVHYSIAKTAGESAILDAYFFKFMITNLKQILKGKVLGKSQEEIETQVNFRAEELIKQRDVIVKALVAKNLEEAVASLNTTQFGEEITKAANLYNEKKNIQIFDIYFDKILYEYLGHALKRISEREDVKIAVMDIDFYNLLSVIRGKFWGLDEQQISDLIAINTPTTPKELLNRMMTANSIRDALNELTGTRYKNLIPQAENELDAISEFERSFEMAIYHESFKSFTRMFSFASIIGITKLTTFEVRNLAAIAYAVEQKIPTDITMAKLIIDSE